MSNFLSLPHWSLILSTTMYGWGTRDTLGHATSFLGINVSRSFCDRFYLSLSSRFVETFTRLLSREICALMVLDNFQQGNQLRAQRGGRSGKFLIGTMEAAHREKSFLNLTRDYMRVEIRYCQHQVIPSPLGMRLYETIDWHTGMNML